MPNLPPQTKADRIALATFGPADIAQIAAFAQSIRQGGEALDGTKIVTIPATIARQFWFAGTTESRFVFNRSTLEFFDKSKPVKRALVKAAADAASKEARFRMLDAALRLQQGRLDVAQWASEHNANIKLLTGAESALSRGGMAEMTMADWERASQLTADQFGYSRKFAEDVAGGRYGEPGKSLNDAVLQRAGMYADNGRSVFENTQMENSRDRLGHTHARRIRGAVDGCPGCVESAAKGWVPIDQVLQIGAAECLTRCHCIIISGVEGNLID